MDKNTIILLRSIDRTSDSTSTSNFKLNLAINLQGVYEILYCSMFNTFYSISTGVNDTIYFYENATAKTATLTAGVYSSSGSNSIATAIASVMTTASGGYATYTAAIGAITNCITITSTSNFQLLWGTNKNASNTAAITLGYALTDTTSATSAAATGVPQLGGPNSVNIYIPNSNCFNFTNGVGNFGNILIPLTVGYGYMNYYKHNDFPQFLRFDQVTSNVLVKILTTTNQAISNNGTNWEIALRFCHKC
jgi:hypothetical protein